MEDDRVVAARLINQLANIIGVNSNSVTSTSVVETASPLPGPSTGRGLPLPGPSSGHGLTPGRSELAQIFSPYPRSNPQRNLFREAGRPAGRLRTVVTNRGRQWSGRFYCLGGPSDDKTPVLTRMTQLKSHGLGDTVIMCSNMATANELKRELEEAYPMLIGIDFALMRGLTGGKGKPLVKISNNDRIPSVAYIRAARVSIVYIVPAQNILPGDTASDTSMSVAEDELHSPDVNLRPSTETTVPVTGGETETSSETLMTGVEEHTEPLQHELIGYDVLETLEDFRLKMYADHPGFQYISISRERILEKIIGVYKDPRFDYFKKPKVEFVGESGSDIGALTREFFWSGIDALVREKLDGIPLFEGEMDHFVPSTDSRLLRTGVFKVVGKLMAHACIHCGISVVGLSAAVAEYLTLSETDTDTPLSLCVKDVPDVYYREKLVQLENFKSGSTLNEDELRELQDVALTCEFQQRLCIENAGQVYDQILYNFVIDKRIRQLDAIKTSFKEFGLLDFLKNKPYLKDGIFPRNADVQYPAQLIIQKLKCEQHPEVLGIVSGFIESLADSPNGLKKLLCAWTGWPILPDEPLVISVEDDAQFELHACFNELKIPSELSTEEILEKMQWIIDYGSAGFGSV